MNTHQFLTLLVAAAGTAVACSETLTAPAGDDSRVQTVRYAADSVIRIPIAEGVVTTIEFNKREQVLDFAMGDRDAWHAKYKGNLFVLKPKDVQPDTNLTIMGERKNYLFSLVSVSPKSQRAAWWVRVETPDLDLPSPEDVATAKAASDRKQMQADLAAAKFEGPLNYDYWIVGPEALTPVAMHDNGRQTYLTFSAANSMPAAFIIEPDGTESIVDYHVEGDTMILHRVAEKIVLRRGDLVAGITNRSPSRAGQQSPTGTTSDKVRRVLREGKVS